MENIIYTVIINGYDELRDPSVVTKGWKYICFTNDANLKSDIWDIRVVEVDKNLDSTKNSRKIKIQYHHYLKEKYDWSIFIDGKVGIKCDLNDFLEKGVEDLNDKEIDMFLPKHPDRNCIYQEIDKCKKIKKENKIICNFLKRFYKKEKYPENIGLNDTCLLIRRYPNDNMIKFMDDWWAMVERWSRRDQFSFNYVLWKYKGLIKISKINSDIDYANGSMGNYFTLHHHKRRWFFIGN
jgi:rRNA-processing protein FCF1